MSFLYRPCGFIAFLVLICTTSFAQNSQSAIDLQQGFLDLSNTNVAMDLSAHPDDEDGSTLAYLRMKFGVHTYSVLFTRGEGGQNEKGPDLYEKLGVLRSKETEEAGKILGAEVRFLNFLDFGFSKTSTETFQKWGGSREPLRRLVYIIRKYKPDIIFTNHNTIDGHGNHQAVAITAIAAFDAAADSTYFPEQLKEPGITVWQPRKLFFRAFGRGEQNADVYNAILDTNAVRGLSYIDIASEALRKHRTQGMERANLRGFTRGRSQYKLMRVNSLYEADSTSFFAGIDIWRDPTVAPLSPLSLELSRWHYGMPRDSMLQSASSLIRRLDSLGRSPRNSPLSRRIEDDWRRKIERVIALSCGVQASMVLADSVIVAGQSVDCGVTLSSPECTLGGGSGHLSLPHGWTFSESREGSNGSGSHQWKKTYTLQVARDADPSLPREVAQYTSLERHQDIVARIDYILNGLPVSLEVTPSFDIAPAQWLTMSPEVAGYLEGRSADSLSFSWKLTNYQTRGITGSIAAVLPRGWKSDQVRFDVRKEDDTASGRIVIQPPSRPNTGEYAARFTAASASATVPVQVFDVKVADGVKLGIVESYDNTLEAASAQLHVPFELVNDSELEKGDLGKFTSIIIDIRAYLVRDALTKFNGRLLEYVRNGGNLIVMYQRDQEWKPEYAPYPFQITRKRVTVEEAPITILAPNHPLLNLPNKIGERDWLGWKQERGLYFPGSPAPEYAQLLSTNDPDEEPLTTGYLVAKSGKGSYMYTSFVWYRELKEENPGAFRCFANMISYSSTRK